MAYVTEVAFKHRTGEVIVTLSDGASETYAMDAYLADEAGILSKYEAPPPPQPTSQERIAMLEAELAAVADPYAQAWEGAKTQIAQWAAFQQLLIEKGVVTQEELDAKAAAIEVAGDGQVTTRG